LAIWAVGKDKQYPTQIVTSGGQLWYDDDHETPDTQTIIYIYPDVQIIYEMRLWTPYKLEGHDNAAVAYGTEGRMDMGRSTPFVTMKDGKKFEILPKDYGIGSVEDIRDNFISAVRNDDPSMLNSPIEIGAVSAILCNLGNIGTRLGNAALAYDINSRKITQCTADLDKANVMLTKKYRTGYELVSV
jgi:hypothetical protein